MTLSGAHASDSLENLRDARMSYINNFRTTGVPDTAKAKQIENQLKFLIDSSKEETLGELLFEMATIQRITNRFEEAINTFDQAEKAALEHNNSKLLFDIYLGIARSHAYNTRNHGAALAAFNHAVTIAGNNPSEKQKYEIADYASQIQAGFGDLDSALLNALEAIRLAKDNDSDLFYAHLDTGDVLQKYAESCDYRKLIDAKTSKETDSWGACRRAVDAARKHYIEAEKIARRIGWNFLAEEAAGFNNRLDARLFLIDQKASFEKLGQTEVFQAKDIKDVLINESFEAGASTLSNLPILSAAIDAVAPESQAHDPRSLYLRGLNADLEGSPKEALAYFQKAARLLREERSSVFDLRRRGTVLENRMEIVRDLGLRLLSYNRLSDAFIAFESVRSHGLGILSSALENIGLNKTERKLLASLVQQESTIDSLENLIVKATIAGIESTRTNERLKKIDQNRRKHHELLIEYSTQNMIEKLSSITFGMPTLQELQNAVRVSNIPVILYWVTNTNVIVWLITPEHNKVKAVFLPEAALLDKVRKIRTSIREQSDAFDEISSRELHTYLIKPFMKHLTQKQVLIIPQGILVNLPFEVLMDSKTDKYLIENLVVSYAPNAAFAIKVLKKHLPVITDITALYDEIIENDTGEISKISKISNLKVHEQMIANITESDIIGIMEKAKNLHVLLHGKYSVEDPLLSTIKTSSVPVPRYINAAQLLAIDWSDSNLAVFSACEGAVIHTRISNELLDEAATRRKKIS